MIQKLFKVTFDSTVIIFDYSDNVKAKVDRGEPVQVIKMGMTPMPNNIYSFMCYMNILMT